MPAVIVCLIAKCFGTPGGSCFRSPPGRRVDYADAELCRCSLLQTQLADHATADNHLASIRHDAAGKARARFVFCLSHRGCTWRKDDSYDDMGELAEPELGKVQVRPVECVRCHAINTDGRRLSRSGEIAGAIAALVQ